MHDFLRDLPHPIQRARRFGRTCIRFCQHRAARVYPQPVIVGGSPKSGTTAIAALLARAVGAKFSNDPFWHVLYHDAKDFLLPDILEGRLTVDEFVQRFGAYFQAGIVKDPDFAFLYPQLKQRFPQSPQIFIVRDPRDNIRSILNRLRIPGNLRDLEPEDDFIPPSQKGWRAIVDGRGLAISRGTYISRLSQRWNLGARKYLDAQSSIHLVRYEDFMADKVGTVERLADELGLAVVNDISGEVDRQYQPRGDHSPMREKFFGRENLRLIEATCAKAMSALGYARGA